MVNKHTVDYHPSPSQLISRIHTLIFLWTPKGFISPESFLNFFLNLYIPPWLQKSFKFSVKITANTFVSQKIECVHFYSCLQAKLYRRFLLLSSRQKGIAIPPEQCFLKIFFPEKKGGRRLWSWKKYQNWQRYQSQAWINSTIFPTFVLLCNNLASSMLKCEGSLT